MKYSFFVFLALAASAASASAITVTTPASGAQVTSPFTLVASTTTCNSKPAVSMGYSIDYGVTSIVPVSFSSLVLAGVGPHILHVKCWGTNGAAGDTDLNITVVPTASVPQSVVSSIQRLSGWTWTHDSGTGGSSLGSSSIVASPSLSGAARQFSMSFSDYGGEIYHTTFGADPLATHFIYDAQLWISDPASVANIEMDLNQVIANGDTVIYGVQCDGWSGTWDYTVNKGTPTKPVDGWIHSDVPCPEPKTWAPNTWHHVQIGYFRDALGNVTYQSVVLDGNMSEFAGATGNSAFSLGWGSTLLTNFQLDGLSANSGSVTAYLDNVTISRW